MKHKNWIFRKAENFSLLLLLIKIGWLQHYQSYSATTFMCYISLYSVNTNDQKKKTQPTKINSTSTRGFIYKHFTLPIKAVFSCFLACLLCILQSLLNSTSALHSVPLPPLQIFIYFPEVFSWKSERDDGSIRCALTHRGTSKQFSEKFKNNWQKRRYASLWNREY